MNNEKCPCCHNHCEKNDLKCNRGIEYFNSQTKEKKIMENEKIIKQLRLCGHYLHHNNPENSNLLSNLSKKELTEFELLLEKICENLNQ